MLDLALTERNFKKVNFLNEKELERYQSNEYIRFSPQLNQKELESTEFINQKQNIVLSDLP